MRMSDGFRRLAKGPALIGVLALAIAGSALTSGRTEPTPRLSSRPCAAPAGTAARPWLDPTLAPECRARLALGSLRTVDDKLALVESTGFGAAPGKRDVMAELGLHAGRGSDGPAGFNGGTAWPTPLTLAASFDPSLAARYGRAVGAEFFRSGRNTMLGPAMDMTRTWRFGRSTESFGEDPFLAASLTGPEVAAIQSQHVIATLKHFAAYTQEQGRVGDAPLGEGPAVNEIVSERALREIYFPSFRAAVLTGGAGAVMCAFPRVNGEYACENRFTLGVLKREWGFDGAVGPDFPDAQRSVVAAIDAGLDSGRFEPSAPTPGAAPDPLHGESLKAALASGAVSTARLDDLVMRRLVPGFRIGVFDHPAAAAKGDVTTPADRALAARIASDGAVLLKNDRGVLPFGPNVRSVAIIGTQAGEHPEVVEQGSPYVEPRHLVTVLAGLRARAKGKVRIAYAPGVLGLGGLPIATGAVLHTSAGEPGLAAEYFANPNLDFSGSPLTARTEPAVDLSAVPKIDGLPSDRMWSVRWTGTLTSDRDGVHRLTLQGSGTARLFVDGRLEDGFDNADFSAIAYANVPMKDGRPVRIEVQYTPRSALRDQSMHLFGVTIGTALQLGYAPPDNLMRDAAAAAAKADVAVVFVGHLVGEGMDRTHLRLAADQDALIEAVAKANPRTVVVLTTGGPVTMPWLGRVAGVLQMWLPGDAYGTAAAGLLFGDDDPGGRLPVTFPADETQGPAQSRVQYPGEPGPKGEVGVVHFDEGLQIGYRYYDAHAQAPLFPFGHGLSYGRTKVRTVVARTTPDGGALVTATLHNAGARKGSEVIQVYVGFPADAGEPPRQLKGFAKAVLKPGETRSVRIALPPTAFEHWDDAAKAWTVSPGDYTLMVGRSSRDVLLERSVSLRGGRP